jgi:hypothetical protein
MHNLGSPVIDRSQRRTLQRRSRSLGGEPPIERVSYDGIKALLKHFGLRTSLIRLKVLDALIEAHRNEQNIGVRGVHSYLDAHGVSSSFLSVREVLKRLNSDGVIFLDADKHYRLSADADTLLQIGA